MKTKHKVLIAGSTTILLGMMAFGAYGVNKVLQANAKKQTRMAVKAIQAACEMYHDRWGAYPGIAEPPVDLPWQPINFGSRLHDEGKTPKWFIDYPAIELTLREDAILDYWENPMAFKFTATGEKFEVKSLGPDGKIDTGDDISNSEP